MVSVIDIKKRDKETDFQYQKRLVYGKLIDKTLSDYDYSEIAELIYGKQYSSESARKMLYGSRLTLEALDREGLESIDGKDALSDIEKKTVELQKERQKLSDQRREYNKLISADGRAEHLHDVLIEAARNVNDTVGKLYCDDSGKDFPYSGNEAVLVLSDWHYGMKTENIFNKYNTEICKYRVRSVVDSAIERIRLHSCDVLHIVLLGDMFHGAIHTSARVASEEIVCDQIIQVSEIIAQSIQRLSKIVGEVHVYSTYGNHARTVQKKKDNIHRDNMERLIPWWLKERLAGDNIHVEDDTGTEFISFDVCGHTICAAHGDLDSVNSSPRLLYTLFQKQFGYDLECIILGDKHHRESFEELGVVSMISGSLCGADDYANEHRLFSTPSQLLLIFNECDGLDAEYRIKC